MKEIEAKILGIDQEKIRTKLDELGAVKEFEKDFFAIYYDTPGRELTSSGRVIRLRKEGEDAVLTFKQRSEGAGGIKVMDEHESGVDDFEAIREVLMGLGYVSILSMRKIRMQFHLDGIHIVIDKMLDDHAYIPVFLEIEAPSLSGVEKMAKKLGFTNEDLSNMSVADLAEYYL